MAHDIKASELDALTTIYQALAKEHETLKTDSEQRIAALTTDRDSKAAELETVELDYKRSIDSARNNSQFWKNAHNSLQDKHIITKNALKILTTEHYALQKELEITKKDLAASKTTVTVANEHLKSARNVHTLTWRALDSERTAHSTTKNQLQFSIHSHGVTYEQLQATHTTITDMHTTIDETQTKLTAALTTTRETQYELDHERIDHEVTRQIKKMLSNDLDTTRMTLATLQADIAVTSQENSPSTSSTRDTSITPAEALAARLGARLRNTDIELTAIIKAHEDLKKTVTDLQIFKNGLACIKNRDCTSCPMHMRQAFRVARANEAEANDIVDKIQHELFEASSELQDCKQAMKEKVGMFVDMGMPTPQGLSSLASSTIVDSGSRNEEDSDDDSIDIYTGLTSLGAMKTRKEENEEEGKEEEKPVLEQPQARDGHRFVQRTLLSHLGIGVRPSK